MNAVTINSPSMMRQRALRCDGTTSTPTPRQPEERRMTDLEALVSIAQTAMRGRGQWCVDGIDDTLRRDIRAMVSDCARILGISADYSETLEGMAIRELEIRAAGAAEAALAGRLIRGLEEPPRLALPDEGAAS